MKPMIIIDAEWEEIDEQPLPKKKRVVKIPYTFLTCVGIWLVLTELLSRWLYGFGLWR